MKYNAHYILKREYLGCPVGTTIRVHDWAEDWVEISIGGTLNWMTVMEFNSIVYA